MSTWRRWSMWRGAMLGEKARAADAVVIYDTPDAPARIGLRRR